MLNFESLMRLSLYPANQLMLGPIIIFGFLSIDRKIFGQGLMLLAFVIICNYFLKEISPLLFQDYLKRKAYILPIKEMSIVVIFYGWLLLQFKQMLFRLILALLISIVGFGLLYQGYNISNIMSSIFFAVVIIIISSFLEKNKALHDYPFLLGYILISLACGLLGYLHLYQKLRAEEIITFMNLVGFTIGWSYFSVSLTGKSSILAVTMSFLSAIGIYHLLSIFNGLVVFPYHTHWLIISGSLPFIASITNDLRLKKNFSKRK